MNGYRLENTLSFEYDIFMLETAFEQIQMERYINESIMLSGNYEINSFDIITEGAKDKFKNIFSKLLESIQSLWARFKETMDGFIKSDKDYLIKYKDTILNKRLADEEYMMYDYKKGMPIIMNSEVPNFNYSSLKQHLDSEEDFVKRYFSKFISKDVGFIERAKQMFRGSAEELKVHSDKINMKDLYDFCIDAPKLTDKIEKDMKDIERAGNEAINIISKTKSTNESYDALYSYVYESVVPVNEIRKADDTDSNKSSDNDKGDKNSENIKNVNGEKGDSDKLKDDVNDRDKDLERIKLYIRLCYGFLGAKMSIIQEMYKGYMFIIRDHVKANAGKKSDKKDTSSSDNKKTNNKDSESDGDKTDNKKKEESPAKKNFLSRGFDIIRGGKDKKKNEEK